MKLWLISQDVNDHYDTYDSAVVAAESEEDARHMHPGYGTRATWSKGDWHLDDSDVSGWSPRSMWTSPDKVTVKEIGTANPNITVGIICASFNAG